MNIKNQFLIAMPTLKDSNFHQAVAYLYEYDEKGAMGIVINKPMRITLGEVLKHLDITATDSSVEANPVLLGGPIAQEQGFVIHDASDLKSAPLALNENIAVSTSKSILQEIALGEHKDEFIVSLGYAGWGPGQLEEELASNSWLLAPVKSEILFSLPFERRWRAAAALIGVDFNRLSSESGHA